MLHVSNVPTLMLSPEVHVKECCCSHAVQPHNNAVQQVAAMRPVENANHRPRRRKAAAHHKGIWPCRAVIHFMHSSESARTLTLQHYNKMTIASHAHGY